MPDIVVVAGAMKGQIFNVKSETVFIGRSSKNDIQINDGAISRKQIKIFRIGSKYFVEDLKSTNGTLINGDKIPPGEGFEVDEGDSISIGKTTLRLTRFPFRKPLERKQEPSPPAHSNHSTAPSKDRRNRAIRNLELIYKVSELLKESWELPALLENVLVCVMEALPRIHRSSILLFDNRKKGEKDISKVVSKVREETNDLPIPFSRSIVDRVKAEGKAIRMSNTAFEDIGGNPDADSTLKIGSVLCVPLISSSVMRGVLYVDTLKKPYGFRKDDLLLLNSLSGSIALAIEKVG